MSTARNLLDDLAVIYHFNCPASAVNERLNRARALLASVLYPPENLLVGDDR